MLTPLSAERFAKPSSEFSPGPAPQLQWLDVTKLVVDDSYQRAIGRRGAHNVNQIAEHFDWSKFAPVIVAPLEGGTYAVVDGQHRATAAMLRGIEQVPCQVVHMDRIKQAAAFAAVNGNVTKMLPAQLYWAKRVAGDPIAKQVAEVCEAADVTIVRTNKVLMKMKVGQTHAINKITKCVERYGRDVMIAALRSITKTSDGNAGFLRSTVIEAVVKVLNRHPEWWANEAVLHQALQSWSWPDVWGQTVGDQALVSPYTALDAVVNRLEKFLAKRLEQPNRKKAA